MHEGPHPLARQAPALQRLGRRHVALPRGLLASGVERALQRGGQVLPAGADGPAHGRAGQSLGRGGFALQRGQFAHQVGGGLLAQGGLEVVDCYVVDSCLRLPLLRQGRIFFVKVLQQRRRLGLQHAAGLRLAEPFGHLPRATRAPGQRLARFVAQAVFPGQQRQGARGGAVHQQAGGGLQRRQHTHDGERVVVVDAALVALLVARGGKAAQRLGQCGRGGLALGQLGQRIKQRGPAGLGAGLQRVDPLGGQVFGARQLRCF